MTKKEELLYFLQDNLFNPILNSPLASSELKFDFSAMLASIKDFSAEGIVLYFWTTMDHQEVHMVFSERLYHEASLDFSNFIEAFKSQFTYDWLLS